MHPPLAGPPRAVPARPCGRFLRPGLAVVAAVVGLASAVVAQPLLSIAEARGEPLGSAGIQMFIASTTGINPSGCGSSSLDAGSASPE